MGCDHYGDHGHSAGGIVSAGRRTIVNEMTLTQTAQFEQTSRLILYPDPLAAPVVPGSVVNVNGILFAGGFMVLLCSTVLREACDPKNEVFLTRRIEN